MKKKQLIAFASAMALAVTSLANAENQKRAHRKRQ